MFDPFSEGYCPQCLLEDKMNPLMVNQMDFWECPSCRLQCVSDGISVLSIIRERGDGQLKDILATDWIMRFTLSRTRMNDITKSDGTTFRNEEELWGYLEKEVED